MIRIVILDVYEYNIVCLDFKHVCLDFKHVCLDFKRDQRRGARKCLEKCLISYTLFTVYAHSFN